MQVGFLIAFEKDLAKVPRPVRKRVLALVGRLEAAGSIRQIGQVKKLAGHKNAYRIRIGNFRLGILVQGNKVMFARILDRKEVYRFFP
ncbi:MAG: hypothetical protein IT230_00860 [Flavobacteriales bacterium]|nr:hypothetical protein [Flavobacteriales bacterium]